MTFWVLEKVTYIRYNTQFTDYCRNHVRIKSVLLHIICFGGSNVCSGWNNHFRVQLLVISDAEGQNERPGSTSGVVNPSKMLLCVLNEWAVNGECWTRDLFCRTIDGLSDPTSGNSGNFEMWHVVCISARSAFAVFRPVRRHTGRMTHQAEMEKEL